MKFALVLTTAAFVVTTAFAPLVASADTMMATPSQAAKIQTLTKTYYKALLTGDAATLATIEAPGYKMVSKDGTPVSLAKLQKTAANIALQSSNFKSAVKVNSAMMTGASTATVTVTLVASADMFTSEGNASRQGSGQHKLDLVKDASGKWWIQKDTVLSSFKGN